MTLIQPDMDHIYFNRKWKTLCNSVKIQSRLPRRETTSRCKSLPAHYWWNTFCDEIHFSFSKRKYEKVARGGESAVEKAAAGSLIILAAPPAELREEGAIQLGGGESYPACRRRALSRLEGGENYPAWKMYPERLSDNISWERASHHNPTTHY